MRLLPLLLALALLAGGGVLGRISDEAREGPRPRPGARSLLGGLSALAVHAAWLRADAAIARRDPAAAVVHLDLIGRLEPQLVGGADLVADRIGGTLAGDEVDPGRRYGLVRAGLAVHDRCVAANPGLARPLANRGRYVLLRVARDAEHARRFRADEARTPFAAARADLDAALEIDPDDPAALDDGAIATFYDAVDALRAGDLAAARAAATAAAALHDRGLALHTLRGPAPESKVFAVEAARGLAAALSAPAGEREARYRAYYERFGGPDGLPALPPPAPPR